MFQTFNLLARTTALDNVALPLLYSHRANKGDAREKAKECLARVGLAERTRHQPSELSGGQQQRVAIARALVNDPHILLADEPTGALDSRTTDEIIALFEELNAGGITVILVTHELDIAARAQRRITFRDGGHRRGCGMNPLAAFKAALAALKLNALRSFLAMLGVIIGVASVIVMVSVASGAGQAIEARIRSLGTNLLVDPARLVYIGRTAFRRRHRACTVRDRPCRDQGAHPRHCRGRPASSAARRRSWSATPTGPPRSTG